MAETGVPGAGRARIHRAAGVGDHRARRATLRYYERAGLLQPVRRQDSSRHRRYSADDIGRLQTLACLRAAGMPLDQMRRYFELIEQGDAAARSSMPCS